MADGKRAVGLLAAYVAHAAGADPARGASSAAAESGEPGDLSQSEMMASTNWKQI